MTLLNQTSNGHVSSMVAVWRTVRALGPMPRDQLVALCGNGEPDNKVSMTLTTWKNLGMFQTTGEESQVSLTKPFENIPLDDTDALRTSVFELLMKGSNCPALLDVASEDLNLASDFVRVATWTLTQDPYLMASWSAADVLANAVQQGMPQLWAGDGRWNSFQDWAYFCGLGMPTTHKFVMNPARAIRVMLRKKKLAASLAVSADVPFKDFVALLADDVPVLEEGRYREPVNKCIGKDLSFKQELRVSPCTSLALLQLDHEGEILLIDRPGDVAARYTLVGRADRVLRSCSHVRRSTPRRPTATGTSISKRKRS